MRPQLVYLAPVEWNGLRQAPQRLAELLSADFDVAYLNPVAVRTLKWKDVARAAQIIRGGARKPGCDSVSVKTPWHIPWTGSAWIDRLNEVAIRRQLRSWALRDYTLVVSTPSWAAAALLRHGRHGRVVYSCMDNYPAFHSGSDAERMRRIEDEILRKCDCVIVSSRSLLDSMKDRHVNVVLAPNGAEVERFLSAGRAVSEHDLVPELENVRAPILGYCGTIGDWVDFELLEMLALRLPDSSLVMIGPWITNRGRELLRLPNIHWLGEKSHDAVPRYCRRFSVGLIPFVDNEVARYVNPIKLYEYLALGLPVVSSAIPEVLCHGPYAKAARNAEEFVRSVEESLDPDQQSENQKEQRRLYAKSYTWDHAYQVMRDALRPVPTRTVLQRA